MANGAKDAWDKAEVVTAVIGSLLLPVVIFVVGNIYTDQQQRAEAARLAQQKDADAAQRNADRIAALLTHLASTNANERLLAVRFVDYLIKHELFPKELSQQELLLDRVNDEDKEVANAASQALGTAVDANPALKKSVEEAAQSNPETRQIVLKATELNRRLGESINVSKIRRAAPQ